MGELLLGTTLLASFLGGIVALLAPCCVSVMLPAYLASAMRRRGGVVWATLVFAAGVATVIVPMRDEGYSTPVLSDPDLAVTKAYDANSYGMMGDSKPGHTFILIGPDGTIRWRADYGGEPKYVMFLPTGQILADLKKDTTAV